MENESSLAGAWRALWGAEDQFVLRIGASLASGVIITGFGLLFGWTLGYTRVLPLTIDASMGLSTVAAALAWCVVLWLLWRRVRSAGVVLWPALLTLAIAAVTGVGMWMADYGIRHDDEIVMAAIACCGGGLAIAVWLPTIMRLMQGKRVIGSDKQVAVHCPSCGYSLVGLTSLRCPECGETFTIDQLIRSQGYGGADADTQPSQTRD